MIWSTEYVSQDWRDGVFIPIHKKVKKELCSFYRGIALLCTTGKILSKILMTRLLPTDVLPETQCGFRRNRSYTDMIFTYTINYKKRAGSKIEHSSPSLLIWLKHMIQSIALLCGNSCQSWESNLK